MTQIIKLHTQTDVHTTTATTILQVDITLTGMVSNSKVTYAGTAIYMPDDLL